MGSTEVPSPPSQQLSRAVRTNHLPQLACEPIIKNSARISYHSPGVFLGGQQSLSRTAPAVCQTPWIQLARPRAGASRHTAGWEVQPNRYHQEISWERDWINLDKVYDSVERGGQKTIVVQATSISHSTAEGWLPLLLHHFAYS